MFYAGLSIAASCLET